MFHLPRRTYQRRESIADSYPRTQASIASRWPLTIKEHLAFDTRRAQGEVQQRPPLTLYIAHRRGHARLIRANNENIQDVKTSHATYFPESLFQPLNNTNISHSSSASMLDCSWPLPMGLALNQKQYAVSFMPYLYPVSISYPRFSLSIYIKNDEPCYSTNGCISHVYTRWVSSESTFSLYGFSYSVSR